MLECTINLILVHFVRTVVSVHKDVIGFAKVLFCFLPSDVQTAANLNLLQ